MIIRIHNTGDPYKLPTLSVHTRASFPLFLSFFLVFCLLPFSLSLGLLAHSFFSLFIPSLFFLSLRQVHRSLWPSLLSLLRLFPSNERRQAACLFRSPFYRVEHRHCGTYPTVRCSRTMALFSTLDTWSHSSLTLSSRLFFPLRLPRCTHVVLSVCRRSGIV